MDTNKKKKTVDIDEEAEARINNAYADFMEKAMNSGAKNGQPKRGNIYRDQTKRMITAQNKKKNSK